MESEREGGREGRKGEDKRDDEHTGPARWALFHSSPRRGGTRGSGGGGEGGLFRFRGGITHRESTYAHLALLLHQSTALHHVGFSVSGASKVLLSSEMPSRREGCLGERATPRAHRRTHTDTDTPRTLRRECAHTYTHTRHTSTPLLCGSVTL